MLKEQTGNKSNGQNKKQKQTRKDRRKRTNGTKNILEAHRPPLRPGPIKPPRPAPASLASLLPARASLRRQAAASRQPCASS